MNPRYAEALRLRLLDELEREECARRLDVTVGTFDVMLASPWMVRRLRDSTGE